MDNTLFKKTKQGYYLNSNPIKLAYGGYIRERNQKNISFYKERKEILKKTFTKLLSPYVIKIKDSFGDSHLNILDLGCGDGVVLESLSAISKKIHVNLNLYGLDLDEEAMDNINCTVNKLVSSSTNIPLEENLIHMIISSQMIEHLTVKDIIKTIKEIKRVLKPGGILYIETPNPESWLAKLMGIGWWMFLPEHLSLIPVYQLSKLFKKNGFVNVKGNTRMETDEQINEVNEIIKRLPRLVQLAPLKLLAFIVKNYIKVSERGSITVVTAKKN